MSWNIKILNMGWCLPLRGEEGEGIHKGYTNEFQPYY